MKEEATLACTCSPFGFVEKPMAASYVIGFQFKMCLYQMTVSAHALLKVKGLSNSSHKVVLEVLQEHRRCCLVV